LDPQPFPVDFRPVTDFSRGKFKPFDCDNDEMNNYLKRGIAHKNHKSNLSPCLVIVPKDQDEPVLGYISVSNSSVEKGDPPAPQLTHFPNYPIPVTLIGRLAVSNVQQGRGLGRRLLMRVFFAQYQSVINNHMGSVGVITDAIDQNAVDFYSKNDFEVLHGGDSFPKRMFIPNKTFFDAIENP